MHSVQLEILKNLLYLEDAGFAELNSTELTNDHFTFHLKRLVKLKLIEKVNDKYRLTSKGLERAGRIDQELMEVIRQPKVGVILAVVEDIEKSRESFGESKVLVGERLYDPLKGRIGFYTEKLRFGEKMKKAARRCLRKETGLVAKNYKLAGTCRILRHTKKREVLVDVLLNYFVVTELFGKLKVSTEVSKNSWMKFEDLRLNNNIPHRFNDEIDLIKKYVLKDQQFVIERELGKKW